MNRYGAAYLIYMASVCVMAYGSVILWQFPTWPTVLGIAPEELVLWSGAAVVNAGVFVLLGLLKQREKSMRV